MTTKATLSVRDLVEQLLAAVRAKPDQRGGAIHTRRLTQDWSKEDVVEVLSAVLLEDRTRDWYGKYLLAERERQRLTQILRSTYHTDKELNHAKHVADLEAKNRKLRETVRDMQKKAEWFNDHLYATGLVVNCTGCLAGAPANADQMTEERVQHVEQIAKRLRSWWTNNQHRLDKLQTA